ncbi:hypothetical protein AK88_03296 [Plasmodium fragile]|uniref:Uncharacterized protein n=1 Tax=Plasmodium fragile TaxID=5857 RepID=A0A0D9QJ07_PLAFR|nr:uncharacterized protein AK88_03296 [Plasmodium fragile]KJP87014.1 hypothetical protein AK88_03296 [Plasmodium fragile]
MGIPCDSLKVVQSALKAKPAGRSCNAAIIKCTARAAVYKKHKGMFQTVEKDIKREGKHLAELLFKKKLHLINEKDISKILKKVIKGKIKNELVWDDLQRLIFCCNVGCAGGGGPLEDPSEGRSMDQLAQTSPPPPSTIHDARMGNSTMNDTRMGHTTPYNRHFDHVNAYLLSIAVQKLNKRSASLLSFLFSYLRDSYRSMEPRHFVQIFLVLVKHTFRDVSLLHGVGPPLHWAQMVRSEKNLLHVLSLHCAENINLFSINDVAMTCEALCFFTSRDNPFIPFWNDVLCHVLGVPSRRSQGGNTFMHSGDPLVRDEEQKEKKRLSPYVRRIIQRRGRHLGEVKKQTNGTREKIPALYFELSGRNMLSIVKYICLYGSVHREVLNPLAKKAKKIFFELPLDTTLHECVEILSLFNSIHELGDVKAELRERINLYERQFGGALVVTQYDVKCLVTLAQLCLDELHFIPFVSIFMNSVHKCSGEDAARLVRLLLVSWGSHTDTHTDACTDTYTRVRRGLLPTLLPALLPACPEVISQLTYTEMLLLCGALKNYTLPKESIIKCVTNRICDDLKKVDLRSNHLPPSYIDYLFLITFSLYKGEFYANTNLLRFLVQILLKKKEDKVWLHHRRYHYVFYLLTLHRGGSQGDASMWVEYFNCVCGNLSPRLSEETLYHVLLIYFHMAKQGDYRSLVRHLGGKRRDGASSPSSYLPVSRSSTRCAKKKALMLLSPYDCRFICNEKQIKEELLKLFLHLWVAYPIRSGRKSLDLLIVMNACNEDAHVRRYLFSTHLLNRISRYVALLIQKKSSLTVHLCEDPVTKEPIRVNLSSLRHAYNRMVSRWRDAQKLQTTKTQAHIQQLNKATRHYILNDYKHKESIAVQGGDGAPQKGRPAKYLRNCKRGEPVLGALAAYGH